MRVIKNLKSKLGWYLAVCVVVLLSGDAFGSTVARKRRAAAPPKRIEIKEAERRLAEMGFWTGPTDGVVDGVTRQALIAFQKMEGRKVNGRITRDELEAIRNAPAPQPRDPGYRHAEIDLDRQVIILVNDEGAVTKILPVSTGSGKRYNERGHRGTAYTPRGRFKVYGKISGWKRSPLGLLYYPSYLSDGIAIHGNPAVPTTPQSHGCIRVPMFAARTVSKMLPVGTIVLIYDGESFVPAKEWVDGP